MSTGMDFSAFVKSLFYTDDGFDGIKSSMSLLLIGIILMAYASYLSTSVLFGIEGGKNKYSSPDVSWISWMAYIATFFHAFVVFTVFTSEDVEDSGDVKFATIYKMFAVLLLGFSVYVSSLTKNVYDKDMNKMKLSASEVSSIKTYLWLCILASIGMIVGTQFFHNIDYSATRGAMTSSNSGYGSSSSFNGSRSFKMSKSGIGQLTRLKDIKVSDVSRALSDGNNKAISDSDRTMARGIINRYSAAEYSLQRGIDNPDVLYADAQEPLSSLTSSLNRDLAKINSQKVRTALATAMKRELGFLKESAEGKIEQINSGVGIYSRLSGATGLKATKLDSLNQYIGSIEGAIRKIENSGALKDENKYKGSDYDNTPYDDGFFGRGSGNNKSIRLTSQTDGDVELPFTTATPMGPSKQLQRNSSPNQ